MLRKQWISLQIRVRKDCINDTDYLGISKLPLIPTDVTSLSSEAILAVEKWAKSEGTDKRKKLTLVASAVTLLEFSRIILSD